MAVVRHEITVGENSNNMPAYRHIASCVCGFVARVSSKVEAETRAAAHAAYHGFEYPVKAVVAGVKEQPEASAVVPVKTISPISIGTKPTT
jgi:hypothetical protein